MLKIRRLIIVLSSQDCSEDYMGQKTLSKLSGIWYVIYKHLLNRHRGRRSWLPFKLLNSYLGGLSLLGREQAAEATGWRVPQRPTSSVFRPGRKSLENTAQACVRAFLARNMFLTDFLTLSPSYSGC